MRSSVIATGVIAALLCGCLPIPHREPDIPAVAGLVTLGGQPVAGAEVYVTHRFNPSIETKVAITSQDGRFNFSGSTRLIPFTSVGDPGYEFKLRIVVRSRSYNADSQHGLGFAPEPMSFTCDLGGEAGHMCQVRPLAPN